MGGPARPAPLAAALLALLAIAAPSAASPQAVASLLREGGVRSRRWDWKSASEESLTEWSIVLRRYYMVDMELADLIRRFGEAFPAEGAKQEKVKPDDMAHIRAKVEKLSANLEAALTD